MCEALLILNCVANSQKIADAPSDHAFPIVFIMLHFPFTFPLTEYFDAAVGIGMLVGPSEGRVGGRDSFD